jgi:hypothetical protein
VVRPFEATLVSPAVKLAHSTVDISVRPYTSERGFWDVTFFCP